VAFHDGCLTGDFTASDAIGELLTTARGGAVAFVGHTAVSWMGWSKAFQHAFVHALVGARNVGTLHDSRFGLLSDDVYRRMDIFSTNLLGDPETPVWTGAARALQVTHPRRLEPSATHLDVSVRSGGNPEVGARVVVSLPDRIVADGRTDAKGECTLVVSDRSAELSVTVSATNAVPYLSTLGAGRHWPSLPAPEPAVSLTTATGANGAIYLFATTPGGTVLVNRQSAPSNGWAGWTTLLLPATGALAAAPNVDGRLELLVVGTDGQVRHLWQLTPDGNWSSAVAVGDANQVGSVLSAGRCGDGRIEVFAIRPGDGLWRGFLVPSGGGAWAGRWWLPGGYLDLSTATNADGRLEVFAVECTGRIVHAWQTKAGDDTSWTGMSQLGTLAGKRVTAVANRAWAGRLEVFAIGADNGVYRTWQTPGGWQGWQRIGGGAQGSRLAVAQNADGRLEAFLIGYDQNVYHIAQASKNDDVWPGAVSRIPWRGDTAVEIAAIANKDGRLELFALGLDRSVYHTWQQTPNGNWLIGS
jgi:Peptidase family C25